MINHPKKPRYPMTWNPDILISYYYKNSGDNLSKIEKYQFLQTKTAILLGFLHMLCPQEAWSCEITEKPELKLEFNKGCWLRTIVKNEKTIISDVWIPNIDLLINKNPTNNNDNEQPDENTQLTNPLNVFYTILLLKSMIIMPNVKRLFVDKLTADPIPRSRYTSMMHKEMIKMGIPPFFTAYSLKHAAIEKLVRSGMEIPKINKSARLAMNSSVPLSHYSPLAANNNAVCILVSKDQTEQKEEIDVLSSLEKEKFTEDSPISEKEKEYRIEYDKIFGDDQEIEDIVQQQEKENKKVSVKEISQQGDELKDSENDIQQNNLSIDPMRQSQKMILINTFNAISSDHKGNTETIVLPSPSFPK
jgi:hypothetical protein